MEYGRKRRGRKGRDKEKGGEQKEKRRAESKAPEDLGWHSRKLVCWSEKSKDFGA